MGVKKHPPENIREIIEQYVAGEGGSTVILGRAVGVSDSTVRKWLNEDEELREAYDGAREAYMHKLYLELLQMARAGKGNIGGIIYTLKAKFKQYDMPASGKVVDVNVNTLQPVMIVKDHGSLEEWAAKCAAQQRALIESDTGPRQIEASTASHVGAVAAPELPAIYEPAYAPVNVPEPVPVPVAPSWAAPAYQPAPVTAAPYYGPPRLWEPEAMPIPAEPKLTFGVTAMPPAPIEAPVWRGRA